MMTLAKRITSLLSRPCLVPKGFKRRFQHPALAQILQGFHNVKLGQVPKGAPKGTPQGDAGGP